MSAEKFPVRICTWEDVSLTDAEKLLEACADTQRLQSELARLLGEPSSADKRSLIVLDMFTYGVLFCKKKGFSPEQLSAFFTILRSVHALCISTPFDNLQETFAYFRELLLRHSVNRPPFSTCLYSIAEVKDITDYVLSTYFKHFKLYKYAFTERVRLNLHLSYSGEEEEVKEEGKEEEEGKEAAKTELVEEGGVVREGGDEKEEEREGGAVEEAAVGEPEEEGKEEEEEEMRPEQQRLKQLISSTLSGHLRQLKVAVEEQLGEHEKRLAERIMQLEASTTGKAKKK